MHTFKAGRLLVFTKRTWVRPQLPWWRRLFARAAHQDIVDAARRKSGVYMCAVHMSQGGFLMTSDAFCWEEPHLMYPVCIHVVGSPFALVQLMDEIRSIAPECVAVYSEEHEWIP